jgi:hypothetical protein
MTESDARAAVEAYAIEYDVPCVEVLRIARRRAWWGRTTDFAFRLDTRDRGPATAAVCTRLQAVTQLEFRSNDPTVFWPPPWAAFPFYNAVTIGWRMGNGERYWLDWTDWFRQIGPSRRAAYRRRFPAPARDCWEDFYDFFRRNWEG